MDQTRLDASGNLLPGSLETELLLGSTSFARTFGVDFAPPGDEDYSYDRTLFHHVVLRVEAVSVTQGQGGFKIEVESAADKPMRDFELTINPLNSSKSLLTTAGVVTSESGPSFLIVDPPAVSGHDWVRLAVPARNGGGAVKLTVKRPSAETSTQVWYNVYSLDGNLLDTGSRTIPPSASLSGVDIDLPDTVTGGAAYYVQVSRANPNGLLRLSARASTRRRTIGDASAPTREYGPRYPCGVRRSRAEGP